ncbi:unnamed protein product [Rangifer tarandus platyrhynchus]|uniref:Uncharacterized protein n=1 Tax=Rangifer tarandus platyrhynchus TaxID=3082113 RepID=A0AC59YIB6_RANTA
MRSGPGTGVSRPGSRHADTLRPIAERPLREPTRTCSRPSGRVSLPSFARPEPGGTGTIVLTMDPRWRLEGFSRCPAFHKLALA